jgi:hypothetical protein
MFRRLWSVSLSIFVLVSIQPILSQVSSRFGESNPNEKEQPTPVLPHEQSWVWT